MNKWASQVTQNGLRSCAGVVVIILLHTTRLLALELPLEVRSALEENAKLLGPIGVAWHQQYRAGSSSDMSETLRLDTRQVESLLARETRRIIFQDGKVFSRRERDSGSQSEVAEMSIDGTTFYAGSPSKEFDKGMLRKTLLSATDPMLTYLRYEYFDAIGFRFPTSIGDFSTPRLQSSILFLLETGGDLQKIDALPSGGTTLMRVVVTAPNPEQKKAKSLDLKEVERELRQSISSEAHIRRELEGIRKMRALPPEKTCHFYLDKNLGYAVVRMEEWHGSDTLLLRSECSEFQKLNGRNLQLPHRCIQHFYTFRSIPGKVFSKPVLIRDLHVTSVDVGPFPDKQFVLDYTTPGTFVADGTLPESNSQKNGMLTYRVPADARHLDQTIDEVREMARTGKAPSSKWSGTRWAIVVVNVVALIACVMLLCYRRMLRKR